MDRRSKHPTYTQLCIGKVGWADIVDFLLWSEAPYATDYVRGLVGKSRMSKGVPVQQTTTAVAGERAQAGISTSCITPPHA